MSTTKTKNRKRYSAKQLEFLRKAYMKMTIHSLTLAFNKRFRLRKSDMAIKSALGNHRIICGRGPMERIYPVALIYTAKQARFLRENYEGRSQKELTRLFNERFSGNRRLSQIIAFVKNRGIKNGLGGHFKKGQTPFNAGTKGLMKANITSFRKGCIPATTKPLGSERICSKDGFILIKIAERNPYTGAPTRYKHKHVHLWERVHGPVPKGMVVVFKDGNKLNCVDQNLILLSRAELLRLNQKQYVKMPDKLKPSVLALAKMEAKMFSRKRQCRMAA
jgi:hypothetical protein